jgi:hypothetical protein
MTRGKRLTGAVAWAGRTQDNRAIGTQVQQIVVTQLTTAGGPLYYSPLVADNELVFTDDDDCIMVEHYA